MVLQTVVSGYLDAGQNLGQHSHKQGISKGGAYNSVSYLAFDLQVCVQRQVPHHRNILEISVATLQRTSQSGDRADLGSGTSSRQPKDLEG